MAVLLNLPYSQFFDDNGDPLAGGLIYTYTAGTTTPKATYTDYSEVTPAANPVVLDSAGRAAIWIVGSYRIDVKTSADVLVRSVDNITAYTSGGDMTKAVYDPANIAQQLVGTTAVQTMTNKTLTSPVFSGTPTGTVTSGTYTPTLTNDTNIAASTAYLCQYLRVGDIVYISGRADVDPTTAAGTATRLEVSLPPGLTSNFTSVDDALGSVGGGDVNESGRIVADSTDDRLAIIFLAQSAANHAISWSGSYIIKT